MIWDKLYEALDMDIDEMIEGPADRLNMIAKSATKAGNAAPLKRQDGKNPQDFVTRLLQQKPMTMLEIVRELCKFYGNDTPVNTSTMNSIIKQLKGRIDVSAFLSSIADKDDQGYYSLKANGGLDTTKPLKVGKYDSEGETANG